MEIIENKALLLRVKNPQQLAAAIPKSKHLGDNNVLVRWGVTETHILNGMNIKVPSPIYGRYSWPGRYKPMAHQKVTSAFLTMHKRALCLSEQGVGKTLSAIWAADFLMEQGLVKKALVVCPVSIMDVAWRADLFNAAMHRSVGIAYGSADRRKKVVAERPDFLIVNYDGLGIIKPEIAASGYDLIIVDECTFVKNVQTKRWKTLNSLVRPDTWLWLMTGTPAAQGPEDAYGLAKLVNPAGVPRFFSAWRDMVMVNVTRFRWEPRPNATDIVFKALQPSIRFTKEECLDLPDMTYVKRDVPLTQQQQVYYKKLKNRMVMEAAGETVTAVNAAVAMNKLLQISCGAVYTDDKESVEFDIAPRYAVLREVLDEAPHKVLVFVPFRHVMDILQEKLSKDGITAAVIRGDVAVSDRTDIFRAFQTDRDPRVLLIQPQSAAHGVTLTAASTIVWWSPTASLETYSQANARVHRTGQTNKCTVVQLQGSPVERRVYKLLDDKIDVNTKLVEMFSNDVD